MKKLAVAFLMLLWFHGSAAACVTLSEQLAHDEPVVKKRLLALKSNEQLESIHLCDNSTIFGSWQFVRRAKTQGPSQHILLFHEGSVPRAVAWVEGRGEDISVPSCPYGERCTNLPEAATIISGDVYTYPSVRANGELVIITYPPSTW